jgi:excisionase family DNA binding protein
MLFLPYDMKNAKTRTKSGEEHGTFRRQFLSKMELAGVLGVSSRTIENWLAERRLPQLRLSPRLTRFDLPKVLAALARYEVKEVGGASR